MVHVSYLLPVGTSKEARAQVITAGLKNPTPDVSRAIAEAETSGNSKHSQFPHFSISDQSYSFHIFSHYSYHLQFLLPTFTDADTQAADSLTKVADLDIDNLLIKMRGISRGILFNVWQALLKEWGPDSLGVLPEDTI